jgi:UPF0755 protein
LKPLTRIPDADLRPRRRSAILRVVGSLLGLGILGAAIVAGAGAWLYNGYTTPGQLKQSTIVDIPPAQSAMEIANLLEEKGVVADSLIMGIAANVQALRGATIKPGEYEFPANASMAEVFNIIASGRTVTYKMTVPEGWTSEMAVARLREHEALTGTIASTPPEGAIIANTYLFARGKDRNALLTEMMDAQAKLVDEVWAKRAPDSLIKTKNELVTLASIVEKETAKPEERPRIAAVFLNRLKAGMRLQSDPTIIYGIAGGKGKLDRSITKADIEAETPYNTYRIDGLPPGPIATPGRDALEAVMNPVVSNELFFVADGTGGHVFAATLEQHNANVQKWREIEKQGGVVTPDATVAAAPAAQAEAPPAPEVPAVATAQLPNVAEEETALKDAEAQAEAAIAAAAKDKENTVAVPPAEGTAAAAVEAAPTPAVEPAPAVAPAQPEAAAAAAAPPVAEPKAVEKVVEVVVPKLKVKPLKPGSLVNVDGTLVPIPELKKKN